MQVDTEHRWLRVVAICLGVVSALAYSDYLIDLVLQPDGIDQLEIISHLEAPGAPYSDLLRASDVLAGVCAVALSVLLLRALPHPRLRWIPVVLLAAFGICGALTGIIPDPCPDPTTGCGGSGGATQQDVHIALSGYTDAAILLCPLAVALVSLRGGRRWVQVAGFVWFAVMIAALVAYDEQDPLGLLGDRGLWQRLNISAASVWLVIVGLIAGHGPPPPRQEQAQP